MKKITQKDTRYARRRLEVVAGFMVLGFVLLGVRAVDLQYLQAAHLQSLAEKQRQRQFTVAAPRGAILDNKGKILAESIQAPSIAAIASEVPKTRIHELAKALRMRVGTLKKRLSHRRGFVWLKRQMDPTQAARVMALNIPGIRKEKEWRRYDPLGPETGHLLGFVGTDGHGLEGLEHHIDQQLSGTAGRRLVLRDARGYLLPGGQWLQAPKAGESIRLYLDSTIQSIAYAALAEGIKTQHAKGGSVVVMRPQDGAILAMVNWPGYNPNNFRQYHARDWRNRAVTDMLEPGSSMKPFTVAAALQSGHWHKHSPVFCENGKYRVANYVIHDDHSSGWLDVSKVLSHSSNIGAAKMALDIGASRLHKMLSTVGFGEKTGVSLDGESSGLLLPSARWGPVETATIAFGQGIAVTPLQLATAFCVLANRGLRVQPRLIQGRPVTPPERVMSAEIADTVLAMMQQAVSAEGTGAQSVPVGYEVAGKTGTAQKPDGHGHYSKHLYTAVFTGIVPVEKPQLVISVTIDEPEKSIYGGTVAAPIFRNIAATVMPYLGVLPTQTEEKKWQMVEVSAPENEVNTPAGLMPLLFGKSLRETRRLLVGQGDHLRVHGRGWVMRQSPPAFATLSRNTSVEVWLSD